MIVVKVMAYLFGILLIVGLGVFAICSCIVSSRCSEDEENDK